MTTHREFAAWIGASETEVGKGLRRLADEGLIESEQHRRGIEILDRERLRAYRRKQPP
jgi:DNA-binding GntR family transcriptional regulator